MTAGNILAVRVWHFTTPVDDSVGGAVPTGTVLYEHLHARISSVKPTMPMLEQGIEVNKLFRANISGANFELTEKDIIEVTAPVIHKDYGKKYRAVSVQEPSFAPDDPRYCLIVTLQRIEKAHGNEYQ